MAEEQTQEKIYPPSEQKLEKARSSGRVFKSNDLTQAFLFLAAWGGIATGGEYYFRQLRQVLLDFLRPELLQGDLSGERVLAQGVEAWIRIAILSLPFLAAMTAVSVGVNLFQVKPLFTLDPLKPKPDSLNPFKRAKEIFLTPRTYRDLAFNLVKFVVVMAIVYLSVKGALREIVLSARLGLFQSAQLAAALIAELILQAGAWFLLTGAVDLFLRRQDYLKDMRMTRKEVEREEKDNEPSPEVRHARREFMEQLLDEGGFENTNEAQFVAVNPTHLAVALRYKDGDRAPRVIAKGRGSNAQKIISLARRHKVKVVRNVDLARKLVRVKLGHEIPESLWMAVAVILKGIEEIVENKEQTKKS